MADDRVFVLHSVPDDWLPLTQNWIWEQVRHSGLPSAVMADGLLRDSPEATPLHVRERDQSPLLTQVEHIATRRFDLSLSLFRRRVARRYAGSRTVVFSHFGYQGYRDLPLAKHRHITRFYGWDLHSFPNRFPRWRARYRELFDRCDMFLVEGAYMRRTLCEQLGCPPEKIAVHHLGTDLTGVPWRERVLAHRPLRVLLAGAFREKKGFIYALEGIGLACREGGGLEVHIDIVGDTGGHPDAETYRVQMDTVIERFGLRPSVTFHGFVDKARLQQLALECDLAIFASVTTADGDCEGGYPITILDTMATGLPAIGTMHCDIPEVITAGTGALCPERDGAAIARALLKFARSSDLLTRASLAARRKAEEYSWACLGARLRQAVVALA